MSAVSTIFLSIYGDDSNLVTDCGNALQNGGALAPDGNTLCDMTCDGNAAEICGGPDRLTLYSYSSGGSTPTSTTTASSPTGTGNPLPGWSFLGCYTDSVSARTLPNNEPVSGGMTNEGCQNACLAAGYSIAGTEYAGECCKCLSLILLRLSLIINRVWQCLCKWRWTSP